MIRIYCFLIIQALLLSLSAKQRPIEFIHIGLERGLSQSTVVDITQDKQGNMWFATHNGLNKFNGYSFTVYQHENNQPGSISNDLIRCCITDSRGHIWVGTDTGLSLYDAEKDRFHNFTFPENGKPLSIHDIVEADGMLWLCSRKNRILLFDMDSLSFTVPKFLPLLNSQAPLHIYRQDNDIYIGTTDGLLIYDTRSGKLQNIHTEALKHQDIYTVLKQSAVSLWIGTEGNGLYRINPETGNIRHYQHKTNSTHSICSNYVRSLCLDAQGKLWVGTLHGLSIYDEKEDLFNVLQSDLNDSKSLSHTSVRDIYRDNQGGMWLGTYYGGVNYYHPFKDRFVNLHASSQNNSLNCNIIACIHEDKNGELWIGTNSGGVNRYNPHTGTFRHYTRKEGLHSNDIKSIHIDEAHDRVYIGTHAGGISILNRQTSRIETIDHPKLHNVYTLEPTENGEFWVSGISHLVRFNPQTHRYTTIEQQADGTPFPHTLITGIVRDSKQRLWMLTEKGIGIYTETNGELQQCPVFPTESAIKDLFINCMHESHKGGIFWIGTRNGFFRYDEPNHVLKQYTTAQGLPNNMVHGIMEDSYGYLWISTDKGLSRFHPQHETFRNFTGHDGIQSNQFANQAYCHCLNGMMYFGGVNGITSFHPEQLPDNPFSPSPIISRLNLFNQEVHPDDETGILSKHISQTESITLQPSQSMISFELSVPNFISGAHNTFAYQLEGLDNTWYYTDDNRTASYSNLPHGTYRFLVKAANSDGKWCELPTALKITILPFWYQTWWAITLFILLFLSVTVFVFYYFWMKKSMKAKLLSEQKDKEHQKNLNEMKLQFFINISHELRTPLTMIVAPLQDLLREIDDRWMHKQLEYILKNTKRLLNLVNQLMDYRRAELGVFHLKVKMTAVHEVVKKSFLLYERLAQRKNITYRFQSELEKKLILCDPNYLELIINNLLSNAFKYTDSGKSITVTLTKNQESLCIQVKDTGQGIPLEKQGKIFERFYKVDHEHLGTGIGLSLVHRLVELHHGEISLQSKEQEGTTFTITLPIAPTKYKPEEFEAEQETANESPILSVNNAGLLMDDTAAEWTEDYDTSENPHQSQKEMVAEKDSPITDDKKCILIVEDNLTIRHYLSDALGRTYRTLEAGHGEEALALLEKQEVDLILTDVMMPVMDGLKLCKHIKQNLYTCHIPVIILSAKADIQEQLEGLQMGADDYIPKPFSMAIISTKIRNLFRTRHQAIEHYSKSLEIEPEKVALNPIDEDLLKRMIEIVEKNIDNVEFSTEQFAREMLMSRSNLHLKIKALTGESANEFIRKIRFNQACKYLKEGKYTVSEISSMVGFSTPSYFTTSFKKYFNCLPSEYGKKL